MKPPGLDVPRDAPSRISQGALKLTAQVVGGSGRWGLVDPSRSLDGLKSPVIEAAFELEWPRQTL